MLPLSLTPDTVTTAPTEQGPKWPMDRDDYGCYRADIHSTVYNISLNNNWGILEKMRAKSTNNSENPREKHARFLRSLLPLPWNIYGNMFQLWGRNRHTRVHTQTHIHIHPHNHFSKAVTSASSAFWTSDKSAELLGTWSQACETVIALPPALNVCFSGNTRPFLPLQENRMRPYGCYKEIIILREMDARF